MTLDLALLGAHDQRKSFKAKVLMKPFLMYAVTLSIILNYRHEMTSALANMPSFIDADVHTCPQGLVKALACQDHKPDFVLQV